MVVVPALAPSQVRALDPFPADGAKPRVCDQFVRSGEHADGVELDCPDSSQQGRNPAAASLRADQSLRLQRDQPDVVRGQLDVRWRKAGSGHEWSVTGPTDSVYPTRLAPGKNCSRGPGRPGLVPVFEGVGGEGEEES